MLSYNYTITFSELAAALSKIKGKIIVLIDSCNSGSAIYDGIHDANSDDASDISVINTEDYIRKINHYAVDAFAAAEEELINKGDSFFDSEDEANAGELRVSKFYVLTASRHDEMSWSETNNGKDWHGLFTDTLMQGVGNGKTSPADNNKDKMITLDELFDYISNKADNHKFTNNNVPYYQHVQAYPMDSSYVLFCY